MRNTDVEFIRRALKAFEEAVDMEEDARRAWLAKQRVSDPNLATEVERLLMADAQALHAMPTGGLYATPAPPPAQIGHYRIVERIGGGGMGEVFVGERADGLFDHQVAIKRMNPSLLPEAARELFDKERRALARLSHRHIAQLFDGGVDETGAPYLIMELVRGAPIDRHLSQRDAVVREIVGHVAAVCDGVQHAHQYLIVHADLKPANILVNQAGDAKIVDFGVARILQDVESAEDGAIYPQTLAYASPQRRAGASPSPADDLYSLGVILKELLTGIPPAAMPTPPAGVSETLKQQAPEGRSAEWIAQRARECAGDLDAIVVRACAENPAARYPSAAEMAEDLRAWGEHRPLKARRGDRAYVLRKFVRRRRLRVIAGAVATAGVLASLATVSVLYAQAEQARKQAEQRFVDLRGLATYLVHDVYDQLEQTPRTLAMRHDLTRVAQGYLEQLAQTPSAPLDVTRDVIEGFALLAELQAGRRGSNLGKPAEARLTLDRAATLLEGIEETGTLAPEDLQQRIRINLLRTLLSANADQDLEAAGKHLAAAQADLAKLPDGPEARRLQVLTALEATDQANWNSSYSAGVVHANTALALIGKLPEDVRNLDEIREAEMLVRTLRGDSYYYLGKPADAAKEYSELIERADVWFRKQPESMRARRHAIVARWNLGTTLLSEGKPQDALGILDQAVALVPQLVEFEPADDNTIRTENIITLAHAQALAATGQVEKGFASVRAQVDRRKRRHEADPDVPEYARAYAITLGALGDMLAENRRVEEACPVYDQANAVFESLQRRNRVSSFDTSAGGWTILKDSMKKYCSGR